MANNRKALCVGINVFKNYPDAALQGCVNDAHDMASVLKEFIGFSDADITMLTDAQATKLNIMNNLKSMVDDARAGKYTYLVFSLSSHGTQVPDTVETNLTVQTRHSVRTIWPRPVISGILIT